VKFGCQPIGYKLRMCKVKKENSVKNVGRALMKNVHGHFFLDLYAKL
jgi:hypothetical protein